MQTGLDRRAFLTRAAAAGGGLMSLGAIERLVTAEAMGGHRHRRTHPYGPLERVPDQRGVEVLALPAGFSYVTFSHTGSTMSDGNPTPLALDGMSAFAGGRRKHYVRLIRNSEDRNPVGVDGGNIGDRSAAYDPKGFGGTTTLVFDERRQELVEDFVSLNGTIVNCAGGRSYRYRSWLTGEESVAGPNHTDPTQQFPKRHGYLFETPVSRGPDELELGEPIVAAGRFSHEAAAVDQRTGIVYETEDPGSGVGAGFYRYIPENPKDLLAGGRLQMLAIKGQPQVDLREGQKRGRPLRVRWVDIDEPDPDVVSFSDPKSTFNQGWAEGGAKFNRLEGCWEDDGTIFFVSTSGGDVKNGDVNSDGYEEGFGQVWAYRPGHTRHDGGTLVLVYESPSGEKMDSPDNLTVTPRGGLIACEDDASSAYVDTHPLAPGIENVNRLIGLTKGGKAFELAVNVLNGSELAGVCFSPSGHTLFFNLFGRARFDEDEVEGMTCAVTGPWHRGPL
jgi:secreted PhoX family phosphatase